MDGESEEDIYSLDMIIEIIRDDDKETGTVKGIVLNCIRVFFRT